MTDGNIGISDLQSEVVCSRIMNQVRLRATPVSGKLTGGRVEFRIPISQKNRPGIDATLVLSATEWNAA